VELNKLTEEELALALEREQKLAAFLEEYRGYEGEDKLYTLKEMNKIVENMGEDVFYPVPSVPSIGQAFGGFQEGNLVVLSAPTGHGKTTFAQTITVDLSEQGVKSLWLTYEVTTKAFVNRMKQHSPDIVMPNIYQQGGIEWAEQKIYESIAKYGCKAVFIDHLHYMVSLKELAQAKSTSLYVGQIVQRLKQIAKEFNIIIFLIAHMAKTAPETNVSSANIRDSSFVQQEADVILVLKRGWDKQIEEWTDETKLHFDKVRINGNVQRGVKLRVINGLFKEAM
jgi:replicative DNA helicase